ncbi:MAG: TonB-dependent receptor [Rhizomicrobium sp.]
MNFRNSTAVGMALALGSVVVAQPARADASASGPGADAIETVVVTAEKRAEDVQKVPINITAIGGAKLATLDVRNVQDLTAYVPSFRVTEPGNPAVSALSLRGVGQRDINVQNEGAVALFVDQAYVSFIPAVAQPIFDVDRIEVLKGPQGTLFGRNATGGLINIVTRQPSQDFDATAMLEYGSYNEVNAQGAIGGALSDTLSARFAIAYDRDDGYIKNSNGPSLDAENSLAARLQLLWEPSSDFHYTVSAHIWRFLPGPSVGVAPTPFVQDPSGFVRRPTSAADYAAFCAGVTHGLVPTPAGAWQGGNCFVAQPDPFHTAVSPEARYNQTYGGLTGTGEWDIGDGLTLTSVTDYQHLNNDFLVDEDAAPPTLFNYEIHDKDSSQFSQELRLSGASSWLTWVAGAYYLNIDHHILVVTDLYNHPGFGVRLPADYRQHTESLALFGQADIDLTDKLTLSLGLRGINDSKSLHNVSTCTSNPGAPPNLCDILGTVVFPGAIAFNRTYDGSFSHADWSGRAVMKYEPTDNIMVYGGVTRGTKSGGFNSGGAEFYPASAVEFKPETLINYEVGAKATTDDHVLTADTSFFYYDYQDYQSFAASTDGGLRVLNVNARVRGAELALTLRPLSDLTLTAGGTYLDTLQYDVPLPGGGGGNFQMPDAPKWSFNGEVRYGFQVQGDDELSFQLNGVYVDTRSISAIDYPDERIPAYHRFDARISYDLPGGKWTAAAFVNNFTDETIIATRVDFVGQVGAAVDTLDRPRWFGGSLTYRY